MEGLVGFLAVGWLAYYAYASHEIKIRGECMERLEAELAEYRKKVMEMEQYEDEDEDEDEE